MLSYKFEESTAFSLNTFHFREEIFLQSPRAFSLGKNC